MAPHHILRDTVQTALTRAQAAGDLPPFDLPDIVIERPRDTTHGDYACPVALRLARETRMNPFAVAEAIVRHLDQPAFVSELHVVRPGFINFRLAQPFVQQTVAQIVQAGEQFGGLALGAGQKVQIECVSANPTGPITIGRTRGGVIGDTLGRLMQAAGYDVELEYYYNDAGRQIMLLGESTRIRALQLLGESAELTSDHYQGDYITDIARDLVAQHGDSLRHQPATFFGDYAKQVISSRQKETLHTIRIFHDTWFNEADLYTSDRLEGTLDQLSRNGYLYEKDGAFWLRTTAFGDDEDRVAIRSTDGIPTYRMGDIVYHKDKADRGFDIVVDIFGPDHHALAPQVLMGVQMLGYDTRFVHTLLHQIVTLMRDGKEVRMSTRRGQFVTLDELIDQVGPDPIRYFFIARSANSHVLFDMDLAVERSDKNPVYYIQNAHVRCCGIFRKWAEAGLAEDADESADLSLLTHEKELAFLRKALELSELIEKAATTFEPHHIAFYALDLASAFHPMYEESRVLHSEVPDDLRRARLRLYRAARVLFARVLGLMGMSAPEVM
jgi:arginyl-tRNA synthetase